MVWIVVWCGVFCLEWGFVLGLKEVGGDFGVVVWVVDEEELVEDVVWVCDCVSGGVDGEEDGGGDVCEVG